MPDGKLIPTARFLQKLDEVRAGRPLTVVAPELGVSFQYLSQVINKETTPGPTLARALGYEQVLAFRKLPPDPHAREPLRARPESIEPVVMFQQVARKKAKRGTAKRR